ncbi:glutamate dehydrogenase [Pseudonocardia sulfidoxydans NBRC 16205]|uniref:Glutamate dehydrogenase n=1 Tax=Pseudonocardia sulfidoxydans NBRC 16205 TaxID=1223511 RepID=A0A511DSI5_9PSEU|nr:NAD-glutamate dehydrogenase [Pseudonocardia sulfidoxydans]GEL26018.1 glutamate dehydrogenase [Pseudonocardia sulfidoxydans NBRC 16205]
MSDPVPHTDVVDEPGAALGRVYQRQTAVEDDRATPAQRPDPARLAARAHEVAATRLPGEPIVRVSGEPGGTSVDIVTDDMPYLVESVLAAVRHAGGEPARVVHPVVVVRRDDAGVLREVFDEADPDRPPSVALVESWMHLDLAAPVDAGALRGEVEQALRDVRDVVDDGPRIAERARQVADGLAASAPGSRTPGNTSGNTADVADLMRWLVDGHFTFLGYRRHVVSGDGTSHPDPTSALGVLRGLPPAGDGFAWAEAAKAPEELVITRAEIPSRVLRPEHPCYVGVRTFDADGRVVGEHRFVGMLTVSAIHEDVLDIPVVERRVRRAIYLAGFPIASYSGQRMLEVISGLPREELFSTTEKALCDIALGVLKVAGKRGVRVFLRPDPYGRFVSCLVYVPRDRYTTAARLAMAAVLQERLAGTDVDYTARVSEASLALVQFTVHCDPTVAPRELPDPVVLADELAEAIRTWDDRLVATLGALAAPELLAGIPESYKASVDPAQAVEDLRRVLALEPGGFAVRLYANGEGAKRFTLYLADAPVTLTAVLPVLQQLGVEVLDERPAEFVHPDGHRCWVYDFGLALAGTRWPADDGGAFCAAFSAAWRGDAETDRFSSLVLGAGLHWREVALLRAYGRYSRQLGSLFGQNYLADVLCAHPEVARGLVALFRARFDPAPDGDARAAATDEALRHVTALIDEVAGLDADRILRSYLGMITATLRTNWFRDRPFFSFKIDPTSVPEMPRPRPRFEIFVYSPRVEGVHLRFGSVARGGLRWSDRPQDYRTEILGLVKAQAVKNAVIVPVGAKGGFVVKAAQPGPDEVEACYRIFISALLDVTDNLVGGATVPPPDVVRHDGDDSYLVVAADKGTARFSDVANDVAASYGFWLGDAFASGGSVGYDHKAMGITARGAWESVKRHFAELGVDTQSQHFTVAGIGDMSGDVFGNGMLLSEHIRLVAAFDHRHVFVDPDPDAARGIAERRRLFALPRSSWDDYDRAAISAGGGVWPRTAKSVPVGPEMRAALGLPDDVVTLSPPELIRAILLAPVDLLWNGGIGTYVKASAETHPDAGDKANDAVRVDGRELRVKVVGEGGNLGLTQRGRIEFARAGGRLNTDAIDNSAGVDCSDHEVNIKILLDGLVAAGELDRPARDALLAEMTDEVAELVLDDNRDQNGVLGVGRSHAAAMANVHRRMVTDLAERAGLDRHIEVLPDDDTFASLEDAGVGLSSPELSTLLAHTKLDLTQRLLGTELPDVPAFAGRLPGYFPGPLRVRHPRPIAAHPLRREIVATMLVNEMVDGGGTSYAFRLAEELSAGVDEAVRAYAVSTAVFGLPELWTQARAADMPVALADRIVLESRRLLDRASRWFLTNRPQPLAVGAETARFAETVRELSGRVGALLCGPEAAAAVTAADALVADGVPHDLARRSAELMYTFGLLDVVDLTELSERDREPRDPVEVATLYYAMSAHLGVDLALTSVTALERGDRWHGLARLALRDDLYASLRAVTLDLLREAPPGTPADEAIALWEKANASRLVRARAALEEIGGKAGAGARLDLATLSVVVRQLRGLAR